MNIEEGLTAKGYTPAAQVPQVYLRPRTIESITIHWWGAFGQTHDGVVNFFVNGPGNTSAHFVCSAGRTTCLVSPEDAAWHAGNPVGNATSIGIECRPEATDDDYREVAELVRWLREQHGDLPLIPHRDWQNTACPGIWDLRRIDALARDAAVTVVPAAAAVTPSVAPVAAQPPTPALGDNQCMVEPGDTLTGIAAQFGVNLNELISLNGITEPDKIFPGMILDLPSQQVTQCVVEEGDTLSGIALQFGRSLQQLIDANPGVDPDLIFPGQVLNLG